MIKINGMMNNLENSWKGMKPITKSKLLFKILSKITNLIMQGKNWIILRKVLKRKRMMNKNNIETGKKHSLEKKIFATRKILKKRLNLDLTLDRE